MTVKISQASTSEVIVAQSLLNEYYEALDIQKRDTPSETESFLTACEQPDAKVCLWIAYDGADPVGCVVLRSLTDEEQELAGLRPDEVAGEIKRLFVRDAHRGKQIGDRLVDALEAFAVKQGYHWMFLDSKDDLYAALRLYRRRGYTDCRRYNTNPQATVFLRKKL